VDRGTPIRNETKVPIAAVVLPLFVVAHLSHHLVPALVTPLLPSIRDSFGFDYTKVGALASAFGLVYGFSQLPAGWFSDRVGYRVMIAAGVSGMALAGILMGMSTGFLMMAAFLVLMGVMGGGYHPSASPLISSVVTEKNRGRALGIHQIGGTASFFLAPLIVAGTSRSLDWRGSLTVLSIPVLVYGLVLLTLLILWGLGGATRGDGSAKTGADAEDGRRDAGVINLVPIIVLNSLVQMLIYSSYSFIPFYVTDHFMKSKETAALMLSVAHIAGLWSGPFGGYLSDRIGRVPILVATGLVAGPLFFLLNIASPAIWLPVVLFLMGMTMYMSMPVTEAYLISHAPRGRRSTIMGIYYSASRGGQGLVPLLLGYMIDRYTFGTAFVAVGVLMSLSAAICTVLLLRGGKR
jgi:MFS family permease